MLDHLRSSRTSAPRDSAGRNHSSTASLPPDILCLVRLFVAVNPRFFGREFLATKRHRIHKRKIDENDPGVV